MTPAQKRALVLAGRMSTAIDRVSWGWASHDMDDLAEGHRDLLAAKLAYDRQIERIALAAGKKRRPPKTELAFWEAPSKRRRGTR